MAEIRPKNAKRKLAELGLLQHQNRLEELVAVRTKALTESNRELEAFSYSIYFLARNFQATTTKTCQL